MSTNLKYTADLLQKIADSDHDHQAWLARGRMLAQAASARQFQIGDWIIEGHERWDHKAHEDPATIFRFYSRQTLETFASVARSVETLTRVKDLPWAHRRAVARFDQERQRELLAFAAKKGMSAATFLKHINENHAPAKAMSHPGQSQKKKRGPYNTRGKRVPDAKLIYRGRTKAVNVRFLKPDTGAVLAGGIK